MLKTSYIIAAAASSAFAACLDNDAERRLLAQASAALLAERLADHSNCVAGAAAGVLCDDAASAADL